MTDKLYYVSVAYPPNNGGDEPRMKDIFIAAVGAYPQDSLVYAGWSQSEDRTLFLEPGKKPFNVVVDDKPADFYNLVALYSDSAAADGFHEFLGNRIEQPEDFPLKKGSGIPEPKSY